MDFNERCLFHLYAPQRGIVKERSLTQCATDKLVTERLTEVYVGAAFSADIEYATVWIDEYAFYAVGVYVCALLVAVFVYLAHVQQARIVGLFCFF